MKTKTTQLLPKEELQRQLKLIHKKEDKEFVQLHYPEFKKLEGKYFKKRNSYGSGKNWWMYIKIVSIKETDVYSGSGGIALSHYRGYSFQICSSGNISVEKINHGYAHDLGKEITKKEFDAAWSGMMKQATNLFKEKGAK
jgi:hypothetical protein